jgi:hypothetical protein
LLWLTSSNPIHSATILQATETLTRFECFSAFEPLLIQQSQEHYKNLLAESASSVLSEKASGADHVSTALTALQREVAVARRTLPTFMWSLLEKCVKVAYKETKLAEMTAISEDDGSLQN